jgi:hypothetical protein
MKARALIDGASFGAETVKAMGEAFDQAWVRIAPTFDNVPEEIEGARLMLAEMILSVATEGNTDVEDLKDRAIRATAMYYWLRSGRE